MDWNFDLMQLFDSHCHLDVDAFAADRDAVLLAASRAGVNQILLPGICRHGWSRLWDLCIRTPGLYPAIGLHPVMLADHRADDIEQLQQFLINHRPRAIGEIGLDYAVKGLDQQAQLQLFESQLQIAERHALPVVLHVRKAHDQVLQSLKRYALPGGFCHAFNGSLEQARRYIEQGFKLGFGGMLTYPRSTHLRALAQQLPLHALVLETDAPDMTGLAHRYQRNSPAYLPEVLNSLSQVRPETAAQIAQQTTDNARQVLRLDNESVIRGHPGLAGSDRTRPIADPLDE